MGFPGVDEKGLRDPTTNCLPVYASTGARDTAVTALGGTSFLAGKGFCCIVDTGSARSLHYLSIAGTWLSVALA